MNPDESEDNI
jgi:hypothetical protein